MILAISRRKEHPEFILGFSRDLKITESEFGNRRTDSANGGKKKDKRKHRDL